MRDRAPAAGAELAAVTGALHGPLAESARRAPFEPLAEAAATADTFRALQDGFGKLAQIVPGSISRVWVPGCGIGQEVYALALLLASRAAGAHMQLFGTDPQPEAVQLARGARYPRHTLEGLAPELRQRFFVEEGSLARVVDELRTQAVFACHDVLRDPPLSHIDFLACRGLLCSLPEAQWRQVFLHCQFALGATGWLFVGRQHARGVPVELFDCVDAAHGLFRAQHSRVLGAFGRQRLATARPRRLEDGPLGAFTRSRVDELRGQTQQRLLELEWIERPSTELQSFLDATQMLSFVCDHELRIVRASSALAERFGLARVAPGTALSECVAHLPGGARLLSLSQQVQRDGQARQCTESLQGALDRSYLVRISPHRLERAADRGVVGVLTDVTPLEQARALAAKRERQQAIIAQLGLAALDCSQEHVPGGSLFELAERALGALRDVLGCEYAAVFEVGHARERLWLRAAQGFSRVESGSSPSAPIGAHLQRMLESQSALALDEPRPEDASPLWFDASGPDRPHAGSGCPLRLGASVLGLLVLYRSQGGEFAPDELHCVQAIANTLAGALARQRARRRLALERGVALAVAETQDLAALGRRVREVFAALSALHVTSMNEAGAPAANSGHEVELWLSDGADAEGLPTRAWAASEVTRAGSALGASADDRAIAARVRTCLRERTTFVGPAADQRSELVIPVPCDNARAGALRVLFDETLALDEELLAGLERAAGAIGEFVQRERLDAALRESEQRFRSQSAELESIYASLPVGVALHDRQLRCVRSNRRLEELQAGSAAASDDGMLGEALVQRVFESGQPARDVELTTGPGSDPREWLCSFAPIRDSHGRVAMVSSVIQDITERKRTEEALRAADRQKDEFLAMLGHELRNPLSAIRNATELLGIRDAGRLDLGRVHAILARQTHQMAKLIDGLLDISRIMRGKFVLETATLDLARVLRELVHDHAAPSGSSETASTTLRSAPIALDLPDEPLWIEGDGVRLVQIFENLLSNATKFTPKTGHISVRARQQGSRVVVRVEDDGAGIDATLLPHIFEPFRQASQKLGGLGLGLALVRGLVELHGGSVTAESRGPGLGSAFTVSFALAASPERRQTHAPEAPSRSRVLVIEDNDDLAETLAALLRSIGHEVLAVADSGRAGLELARAHEPDVVLCDIGLPGDMDGLDVARAIRGDARLRSTRLIALTGYGTSDDRARIRDAGFDACMVKPVELEVLQKHLAQPVR